MAAIELFSTPLYTDANLLAYYRLEDVNDSEDSGTDYNLTNNNTVTFAASKFNNGADFGAANGTKSLSSDSALGWSENAITLTFWYTPSAAPASGAYQSVAKIQRTSDDSEIWILYGNPAGTKQVQFTRIKRGVTQTNVIHNVDLGTGTAHMLTITWDGSQIIGYLNGAAVESPAATTGAGNTNISDKFCIGQDFADNGTINGDYPAKGLVDDTAIFGRALTATEISNLYNGTWPQAATGSYSYFM